MDHAMHGHWTNPLKLRWRAFFLPALTALAALWATEGAAGQSDENGARQMVLAPEAETVRLLPFGIHNRPLSRGTQTGLAVQSNWRKLTIPAGPNGHFFVTARVKKQPPSYSLVDIHFLVDTGASLVALTRSDAEALGFDMRNLDFSGISQTANGQVRFASVMLPELRVGSFKVHDLPASVVDGDLEISLLGNSFLGQLKSYQVANDQMVLRW
jgi:aspartyl protease family protein